MFKKLKLFSAFDLMYFDTYFLCKGQVLYTFFKLKYNLKTYLIYHKHIYSKSFLKSLLLFLFLLSGEKKSFFLVYIKKTIKNNFLLYTNSFGFFFLSWKFLFVYKKISCNSINAGYVNYTWKKNDSFETCTIQIFRFLWKILLRE